jgi:hypothetical protein
MTMVSSKDQCCAAAGAAITARSAKKTKTGSTDARVVLRLERDVMSKLYKDFSELDSLLAKNVANRQHGALAL